jgi:DNA modification methylase/uncharacterized protein Usg
MQVEMMPVTAIRRYPANPRKNKDAVAAVVASIREFGFQQPIVVDETLEIVVGDTRYLAALELGLTEVPVKVARGLTTAQIKAYRIADNRVGEIAVWDNERLAAEFAELERMDFNLCLTGFPNDELQRLMHPERVSGLVDPDTVPAPPDEPTTKPGDLWILGQHRLLCGDSAKAEDVDRLLAGAPIHMVNTDPPYNVKVEPRSNNAIAAGLSSFQGTTHHQGLDLARHPEKATPTDRKLRPKDRPLQNDFVTDEQFRVMLRQWFGNIARVLLPGRALYAWGGWSNCANYPPALAECGLYFSQAIIWVKEHPVLTRKDFMGNHEWCQPAETKISMPGLARPLTTAFGNIGTGDRVVSYSRNHDCMVGLRQGQEVACTERQYEGPLHEIRVGHRRTCCTPGHLWSVKLHPDADKMWCVYLMRRGKWWRAGKSKLLSTYGFGLKHRLTAEDGEEAWILSVHGSNVDAMVQEQFILAEYGIPTAVWSRFQSCRRTLIDVAKLYERLDLERIEMNALRAIVDHGRCVHIPFVRRHRTSMRPKHGRRAAFKVRASNLLPGAMMLPIPTDGQKVHWEVLDEVGREYFSGIVRSMDVDHYGHYVADGIVTHNCFYSWREGAAHQFFGPHNATDVWSVKKVNPQSMIHLTEKPVELAARALEYSSRPGENVLDLFGGSGSTLIAAEQTGRRAFLMEIDPRYCDVIVQRWERFTGKKAELAAGEMVA